MSFKGESDLSTLPLALTMGEPAGIGGEIALKAWRHFSQKTDRRSDQTPPVFFSIDSPHRLEELSNRLDIGTPVHPIETPEQAASVFADALPVIPLGFPVTTNPGRPNPENIPAVIASIDNAIRLVQEKRASGIVTNPIHKKCLSGAGFAYLGHTEYLAERAGGSAQAVMMLAAPELRVVPVTVHVSLSDAIRLLTTEMIVRSAQITVASLSLDFGIQNPRLVVAALNPHAGEGGKMGCEETEIIAPAVEEIRQGGINVTGPFAADSLFHPSARSDYDVALCMYHDQALIPLKTVDFENGVNITLGLPFIRTSPDHGTAMDIAGRGGASELSLLAALKTARDMARHRNTGLQSVA
jgi:4-hydroxythreonine-4-phosphate dehydrogenase